MKNFLKNILLFGILSIFGYLILLLVWGYFLPNNWSKNLKYGIEYGFLKERLKEADTIKNVDVLIIGSSHAYRGYDTRIFKKYGLNAFNLGSSSQTPVQSKMVLEKYLTCMNPKLVVFDVYPNAFCSDGIESNLDFLSNKKTINKTFFFNCVSTKNIMVFNTLVFAAFNNNFPYFKSSKKANNDGQYISGGYVETSKEEKKMTYVESKYDFLPLQIEAFKESISLLNKKKIKFILIQSPLRKHLYESKINNKEVDIFFKNFKNYTNFNTLISLKDDCFADDVHLNNKGVKIFNLELLKNNNFIKNSNFNK